MNIRHTLFAAEFAKRVNQTVETLITEETDILRKELQEDGILSDASIEKLLSQAKIPMQAKYLPIVKKRLEDKLNIIREAKANARLKAR